MRVTLCFCLQNGETVEWPAYMGVIRPAVGLQLPDPECGQIAVGPPVLRALWILRLCVEYGMYLSPVSRLPALRIALVGNLAALAHGRQSSETCRLHGSGPRPTSKHTSCRAAVATAQFPIRLWFEACSTQWRNKSLTRPGPILRVPAALGQIPGQRACHIRSGGPGALHTLFQIARGRGIWTALAGQRM